MKLMAIIFRICWCFFLTAVSLCTSTAQQRKMFYVNDAVGINTAMRTAQPGDTLIMYNGIWSNQEIIFSGKGAKDSPIVLTAETPGKVILSGKSSLHIAGQYLVVKGLVFTNGNIANRSVIEFRNGKQFANNCRLSHVIINNYQAPDDTTETHWISLYGTHNRVDHCTVQRKKNEGTTLVVWLNGTPNYDTIDHNRFGPRPPLGRNGGEIIRVGTSAWSMTDSYTTVENNYFDRCDGEIEVISNKSCHNTYKNNTFYKCQGTLTLRHGHDNLVEGNKFFGDGKPETGGVRIIGSDQKVIHNYFKGLTGTGLRAPISVMNAQLHPALNGYWPVKNVTIAGNTIKNCREGIVMGSGAGQKDRVVALSGCHIDNNKIIP